MHNVCLSRRNKEGKGWDLRDTSVGVFCARMGVEGGCKENYRRSSYHTVWEAPKQFGCNGRTSEDPSQYGGHTRNKREALPPRRNSLSMADSGLYDLAP